MNKKFLKLSVLLLCIVSSVKAFAFPFDNLYVFGDSLSDIGNDSILTNGTVPGPASVGSTPTYYQGHFTNGPNYIDDLAAMLGLSVLPSLSPTGGNDYAYGSARTNSIPPPLDTLGGLSVKAQVAQFVTGLVGSADPNALYVLWAGANNIQDALKSATPGKVISDAVADIGIMLNELNVAGARHFLVPDAPNIGLVPRVTELNNTTIPGISAAATSLSKLFNQQLDAILNGLSGLNIDIKRFDVYSLVQEIVNNPGLFGFTNVTDRCYTGDDLNWTDKGTVCSNPDSYLFWDGIHPTAHGHTILAEYAYQAIVPAPATLTLFILGLGLMGVHRAYYNRSGALPA